MIELNSGGMNFDPETWERGLAQVEDLAAAEGSDDEAESAGIVAIPVKVTADGYRKRGFDPEIEPFDCSTCDPIFEWFSAGGHLSDDEDEQPFSDDREALIKKAAKEIEAEVARAMDCLISRGCLRADGFAGPLLGDGAETLHEPSPVAWLVISEGELEEVRDTLSLCTRFGKRGLLSGGILRAGIIKDIPAIRLFRHLKDRAPDHVLAYWGEGQRTPDLLPQPDEEYLEWAPRVAVPIEKLRRDAERWTICGKNPDLFRASGTAEERGSTKQEIEWVIPGLLMRGAVLLVLAEREAGKSTMLSELIAKAESNIDAPRRFLDVLIEGQFITAMFIGEDSEAVINDRCAFFEPAYGKAWGVLADTEGSGRSFDEWLGVLEDMGKLDIVIIDPAKKHLGAGKEDSSDDVGAFFDKLEALARRKNCAVIVAHHLKRGRAPARLGDLENMIRGSGVFLDRPRLVLGMIRRGDMVEIGIIKHNIPPSQPIWGKKLEGKFFRRDSRTLTLDPIPAANGTEQPSGEDFDQPEAERRVVLALESRAAAAVIVRRTGKNSLFGLKCPELNDHPRRWVDRAVAALILRGDIIDDPGQGLIIAQQPADADGPSIDDEV